MPKNSKVHVADFAHIEKEVRAILERGNTAEIKPVKDGIVVLEVRKTIKCKL